MANKKNSADGTDYTEPKVGSLIIAKPFWRDETYKRAVILLLEHDGNGSAGLIINKPSTLTVYDALPDLNILQPLYFGGVSEIKTVSYIHCNHKVSGAIPIGGGLYWGGDFGEVADMLRKKQMDVKHIKFCAGFVHWTKGQLVKEIQKDQWWIDEIDTSEVFLTPPDDLWAYKLVSTGHLYGLLNNIPDPNSN
jgi:putative transcriptional regulator